MIIDVTPAIINKTAIYRIIVDVLDNLGDYFYKKVVCGKDFENQKGFDQKIPFIIKVALRFPRIFLTLRPVLKYLLPRPQKPVLFFDPLYLLFYHHQITGKCFVLDMTPVTFPAWHGSHVAQLYQRAFFELAHSQLNIIAISESTKLEVARLLKISSNLIKVIHLYTDPIFNFRPTSSSQKIVLFVGSFEPRKNLLGLIEGFLRSSLPKSGYQLEIIGAKTPFYQQHCQKFENHPNIKIWGYLSDKELHDRYQSAAIFAYPSFWEGFGVPLLEAMNTGIPCFASKTGACPEVGGPDMLYVDPSSIDDIAKTLDQMGAMSEPLRHEYVQKQFKQAHQFSRERFLNDLRQEIGN